MIFVNLFPFNLRKLNAVRLTELSYTTVCIHATRFFNRLSSSSRLCNYFRTSGAAVPSTRSSMLILTRAAAFRGISLRGTSMSALNHLLTHLQSLPNIHKFFTQFSFCSASRSFDICTRDINSVTSLNSNTSRSADHVWNQSLQINTKKDMGRSEDVLS